jgi:hypothetical protein
VKQVELHGLEVVGPKERQYPGGSPSTSVPSTSA